MSSSIEEQFDPPEWATKEEVIKAAWHYINYWKVEAKTRNGQWLECMAENARLKAEVERLDALCKKLMTQHSDISCENIMLRNAGDEMSHKLKGYGNYYLTSQWEDAKEGKQP